MKYKHILVAVELSYDSNVLIDRAVFLAKLLDADVSFIHIDGTHGEIYPDMVDIRIDPEQRPLHVESMDQLHEFADYANYPIKHFIVGTGDLGEKLKAAIAEHDFDLLICGHHHDFWSKLVSNSRPIINKSPIDVLVVPIDD
ncbi:universal stress protein [Vibrio hangzhouensis]|uniref:Universal stress protein n=1 Tax=Vibrio hangzhouensis TaxID=462991 RepID=A0A1H5VGY3_9VIBR|nr:universal stress protein [Vibrio hangzhouensis]MBY6195971.1 universal stress protein [Vibrio hangzhouensis]SEF86625.1 Nucleotide-binding universal stress protein, UspA family [Vibrio hangzhouensis]